MVDAAAGANGQGPITRITPEVPFPEAETRDVREYYAAPWPLSEDYYLVAYSPKPLVWEPGANTADALGIYLLDRFGNRELLYRDPEIGSTNPCPLRARPAPPVLPSALPEEAAPVGEYRHAADLAARQQSGRCRFGRERAKDLLVGGEEQALTVGHLDGDRLIRERVESRGCCGRVDAGPVPEALGRGRPEHPTPVPLAPATRHEGWSPKPIPWRTVAPARWSAAARLWRSLRGTQKVPS